MALVELPNRQGAYWGIPFFTQGQVLANAINEGIAHIGKIKLSSGAGTSKTISAAGGGKIYFVCAASTVFSNAASTFRIGIQDVSGGLGDGTYDVFKDLIGGTDPITSAGITTVTMGSGTKTIADGDEIAVVGLFTAFGAGDAVRGLFNGFTTSAGGHPYYATNNTSISGGYPCTFIEFDDGTIGWFEDFTSGVFATNTSFNSGSTPDEIGLIFQVPFKCSTKELVIGLGDVDSGETGEFILYSDPLGTPVAEEIFTLSFSGDSALALGLHVGVISEFEFSINTDYCIAYRPTTAANRSIFQYTLPTAACRIAFAGGTNMRQGTRTDQTGAFAEDTGTLPVIGFYINKLDNGAGGGGGGTRSYAIG